jgi:hypothetical protein
LDRRLNSWLYGDAACSSDVLEGRVPMPAEMLPLHHAIDAAAAGAQVLHGLCTVCFRVLLLMCGGYIAACRAAGLPLDMWLNLPGLTTHRPWLSLTHVSADDHPHPLQV